MKVLIAVDGSECSDEAVKSVIERAWRPDTEFRVITVVEPLFMSYPVGLMYVEPMENMQAEFNQYCKDLIKGHVAKLASVFPNQTVSGEVIHGSTVDAILDEIDRWHADLLVVGSHGRRGFAKLFIGSIAGRLVSSCPCSIEVAKQRTPSQPAQTQTAETRIQARVG